MRRQDVYECWGRRCFQFGLAIALILCQTASGAMGADAADTSALVQTMERLKERRRAIGEEIRSVRPGSPEFRELQAEDMRIAKEMEAVDRQYDEEHRRWHDAFHRRIKDRSFVMHTHPSANALLRAMYPRFLASLPPHGASAFPQQLYCDAIANCDIIESLNNRESQLGIIRHPDTGPERKDLAALWRNPIDPTQRVFAHGVTVVIVHQSNPVRQMTFEQVEQAYQEHAGNWGAFGAWERSIERIGTGYPLLSWSMFTYHVLGGRRIRFAEELAPEDPAKQPPWEEFLAARREREGRFPGRGPFPRYQDDAKVAEEVAKRINAIGYCLLEPNESLPKNVKALAITPREGQQAYLPILENIRPATKQDSTELMPSTAPAIANSGYPLADTFVLYMHPDASPEACEFAAFLTGPEGVAIIKQFGLWPEYELEQVRGEQRVADVKAGKGQPVAVCDLAGVGETIKAAALEFARAKMAVQVTFDAGGGSGNQARERLKTGEAELLLLDGKMDEALRGRVTEEGGQRMVLGSRAVGVVVHPRNSFNELTMDDLRQILAGKVDRWPGATGTAERIVLYALPATNPLMPLVDRAMGADLKRAKMTVRPDSQRVILSVAAQPGALGLVDLTKVARHETKVKLLAILPPGEMEGIPPTRDRVPEGYPLASPVALHLSPKASDAAQAFFAFLNEGGGRNALLAGGLVPRPEPEAIEAEVAAAYGPADEPQAVGPPAQVAAANEDESPATAAPDPLQDVLRGALGGEQGASPSGVVPAAAQAGADQTAENAAASTALDPNRPTPRQAEETAATQPVLGKGGAPHPAASEPAAAEGDFAAWITARAVPIGLAGLGVVAVAVALGAFGMKRARHRNEVMRRYRP